MRLFKTLALKLFRDVLKNFKQFISIIFIIGISVTLYVGLDANARNFESRVQEVYKIGNIADEWITITPLLDNPNQMENDLNFVKEKADIENGGEVDTRFYLPCDLASSSIVLSLVDHFPILSKPYNLNASYYTENDMFFVDASTLERINENRSDDLGLDDTIQLNISTEQVKGLLDSLIQDPDSMYNLVSRFLENYNVNEQIENIILTFVQNHSTEISTIIESVIDLIFNQDMITLDVEINGIMNHPENIDSGEFSTSTSVMSTRLLLNKLVGYIGNEFSSSTILSGIESAIESSQSEIAISILNELKNYFSNTENALAFDANVAITINNINNEINSRSNTQIEQFISSFYNQILAKVSPNVDFSTFEEEIKNYYDSKQESNLLAALSRENYPTLLQVENDKNQAYQLTNVFPIIFFVVAILIVLTTISSLILKDRVQIGTFKALGIKTRNILFYYLAEMSIITLIGIILGFIIGPLLIPFIMNIKYDILYTLPSLGYYFPFLTSFIVLIVIVLLVVALTTLLIFNELRLMPSESMRTKAPKIRKFKAHKHIIKSPSFMMAIRNIKVHFAKSIMVIIGVMGCTGLLICGMGIDDTLNYGKNRDLENFYNADLNLSISGSAEVGKVSSELENLDEISIIEEYSSQSVTVYSENKSINTNLYGIKKNSYFFKFDKEIESESWDENGVAITQSKAEELDVSVGDEISFDVNGTVYRKEVSYVFYAFFVNGIYLYQESEPELFTLSTGAWANLKEGIDVDTEELKNEITSLSNNVYSIMTKQEMDTRISGYMSSISMMTNTVKVFAILLAIVVLINLSILNYNERLRELATLKVLGFSRTKIVMSLLIEMLILTIVGAGIGLFLGLPLEYMVLSVNVTPLVSWLYLVYPQTYVISFFLSLCTALIVNLFMYIKVNNISMSESLKSVEE